MTRQAFHFAAVALFAVVTASLASAPAPPAAADTAAAHVADPPQNEPSPDTPQDGGAPPGVATTKLLPDATAFESWSKLERAAKDIATQVQEVALVRNDLESLRDDLATQQGLWHGGEEQLENENEELRKLVTALEARVREASPVSHELEMLKQNVTDAKREEGLLERRLSLDQAAWRQEQSSLESRREDVKKSLTQLHDSSSSEVNHAHQQQAQLKSDANALKLKVAELNDRIKDEKHKQMLNDEKTVTKGRGLQKQLADMEHGLEQMRNYLASQSTGHDETEAQLVASRAKLDRETLQMIDLQRIQGDTTAKCTRLRQERKQILCEEKQKLETRRQEAVQFCEAAQAQSAVLQQSIQECEAARHEARAATAQG